MLSHWEEFLETTCRWTWEWHLGGNQVSGVSLDRRWALRSDQSSWVSWRWSSRGHDCGLTHRLGPWQSETPCSYLTMEGELCCSQTFKDAAQRAMWHWQPLDSRSDQTPGSPLDKLLGFWWKCAEIYTHLVVPKTSLVCKLLLVKAATFPSAVAWLLLPSLLALCVLGSVSDFTWAASEFANQQGNA